MRATRFFKDFDVLTPIKPKISLARRGDVLRMGSELSKYWYVYCRWAASVSIGKIDGIFSMVLRNRVPKSGAQLLVESHKEWRTPNTIFI